MLNFSSISEGKALLLAVKIFETKKTVFNSIEQLFFAIVKSTTINNINILEGLSISDRNRLFDTILTSENADVLNILSEECVKRIRISALNLVYQKHELSETKNQIIENIGASLFSIFQNISIEFSEDLSFDSINALKKVAIEDLLFLLSDKVKNSKLDIDGKVSIDVLNLSSEKDLNKIILAKIADLVIEKFSTYTSLNLPNMTNQLIDISNKIFSNLAIFVQNEIKTYATQTTAKNIREREKLVDERERDVEEKERKIQEIMTKNLEFSRELQRKSSEIDAKLDQIETQKLSLKDYMDKIIDLCKNVIEFSEKIK